MGTLSYTVTMSLDGYAADADGDFQWSAPGDEVFALHVQRLSEVTTEVLGRRTFALMEYWRSEPEGESWSDAEREFARRWQGLDHYVASATLTADDVDPGRACLVSDLTLEELDDIVEAAAGEVEIFGPTTAAEAVGSGRVRDFRFFIVPKVVGGGLRALPEGVALDLRPVEHRVFDDGTSFLHLRAR
ncbi:deaminase [Brachybacterium endophyticum]|uniref:Deaminase n=1 Tax=Brachybacterium endophyticum TaxID=2182385 RepID=A0A2U2RGR2_9MICO|nr:dihydrofolate reductase family protein [Brachybacterium endophyticum]PWH05059.1 deaminase [Brachybacterium endophyticum]